MNTAFKIDNKLKENLLTRLAKDGLMKNKLASMDGSNVYLVNESWQLNYLKDTAAIVETLDSDSFEAAARNSDIATIFVPKSAAMTQEIAERILTRSGQTKTVFWEA